MEHFDDDDITSDIMPDYDVLIRPEEQRQSSNSKSSTSISNKSDSPEKKRSGGSKHPSRRDKTSKPERKTSSKKKHYKSPLSEDSVKCDYENKPKTRESTRKETKQLKFSKQAVQGKKHCDMKEPAVTALERYNTLEARDVIIRATLGNSKMRIVGTCPDMCPEKERYCRMAKNCLSILEMRSTFDQNATSRDADHCYMVKEYSRSSADQQEPLPHELRPMPVLKFTMDYILCNIMDLPPGCISLTDWYDFIWNRTRSIRKDITQQQLCNMECVEIIEKCVRFHIHCAEALSEEDTATFDPKINNENLMKCLQTIKHMYQDLQSKGIQCPNEAEFRSYDILLSLTEGETLRLIKDIRKDLQKSPLIKFAFEVASAFNSNNYVRFFKLIGTANYLSSCILNRYIIEVRVRALRTVVRAYTIQNKASTYPISRLVEDLKFENEADTSEFCRCHGLEVNESNIIIQRRLFSKSPCGFRKLRSFSLVESKKGKSLALIINNGELPPNPLHVYQPHDSFDSNNILKIDSLESTTKGADVVNEEKQKEIELSADDEDMDIEEDVLLEDDVLLSNSTQDGSSVCERDSDLQIKDASIPELEKKRSALLDQLTELESENTEVNEENQLLKHNENISLKRSESVSMYDGSALSLEKFPIALKDEYRKPFEKYVSKIVCEKAEVPFFTSTKLNSPKPVSPVFAQKNILSTNASELYVSHTTSILCQNQFTYSGSYSSFGNSTSVVPSRPVITNLSAEIPIVNVPCEVEKEHIIETSSEAVLKEFSDEEISEYSDEECVNVHEDEISEKMEETIPADFLTAVADDIIEKSVQEQSALICEEVLSEEKNLMQLKDDARENNIASQVVLQWKHFTQRSLDKKNVENSLFYSPWQPMLLNEPPVSSGVVSPITVYKKHCTVMKSAAEILMKQTEVAPGWKQFNLEDVIPILPFSSAYFGESKVRNFYKLCIVFPSIKNNPDLKVLLEWFCALFGLVKSSYSDFQYDNVCTLHNQRTVISMKLIHLDDEYFANCEKFLHGVTAMILFVPEVSTKRFLEDFELLIRKNALGYQYPLYVYSKKAMEGKMLEEFISFKQHKMKCFSTVRWRMLEINDYENNSVDILKNVIWSTRESAEDIPFPRLKKKIFKDFISEVAQFVFIKITANCYDQGYHNLAQNPTFIIKSYNDMWKSWASLLCSEDLMNLAKSWPPIEIQSLLGMKEFIDIRMQKKCKVKMETLLLPHFDGEPLNDKHIRKYAEHFGYKIPNTLLSPLIDWVKIIKECSQFLILGHIPKIKNEAVVVYYKENDVNILKEEYNKYWSEVINENRFGRATKRKDSSKSGLPVKRVKMDSFTKDGTLALEKMEENSNPSLLGRGVANIVANRMSSLMPRISSDHDLMNSYADHRMAREIPSRCSASEPVTDCVDNKSPISSDHSLRHGHASQFVEQASPSMTGHHVPQPVTNYVGSLKFPFSSGHSLSGNFTTEFMRRDNPTIIGHGISQPMIGHVDSKSPISSGHSLREGYASQFVERANPSIIGHSISQPMTTHFNSLSDSYAAPFVERANPSIIRHSVPQPLPSHVDSLWSPAPSNYSLSYGTKSVERANSSNFRMDLEYLWHSEENSELYATGNTIKDEAVGLLVEQNKENYLSEDYTRVPNESKLSTWLNLDSKKSSRSTPSSLREHISELQSRIQHNATLQDHFSKYMREQLNM